MMKEGKMMYAVMLLVSTSLGALGQIFFKLGVMVTGDTTGLLAYIIAGMIAYLLSTVIYFYVLSRTHLSWAYSFAGLSFVFASLIAFFFLGESVPLLRWDGILLIAIGTSLIGVS